MMVCRQRCSAVVERKAEETRPESGVCGYLSPGSTTDRDSWNLNWIARLIDNSSSMKGHDPALSFLRLGPERGDASLWADKLGR